MITGPIKVPKRVPFTSQIHSRLCLAAHFRSPARGRLGDGLRSSRSPPQRRRPARPPRRAHFLPMTSRGGRVPAHQLLPPEPRPQLSGASETVGVSGRPAPEPRRGSPPTSSSRRRRRRSTSGAHGQRPAPGFPACQARSPAGFVAHLLLRPRRQPALSIASLPLESTANASPRAASARRAAGTSGWWRRS